MASHSIYSAHGNGNGGANENRRVSLDSYEWSDGSRWQGIKRPYTAEDVDRLRGSVSIEYTLARLGAERLWDLLHHETYVPALGAVTGNQAVQMVQAGLKAIYASGWQVAADANLAGETYPDQSLYPSNSVPNLVRRINSAFKREDEKQHLAGRSGIYWFAPIVADAEAGFGGCLNAFELMKEMIEVGAAAVHFEDQLSSVKKCGHLGGKVLVSTREFTQKLASARLAADTMGVPTILVARTDAKSARLITSDVDPADQPFLTGDRTSEGFFIVKGGMAAAIARGLAYAPYADMLWFETSEPDLDEARKFADVIHETFPGKLLAYNCSPSFNWEMRLDSGTIARFQTELAGMGYKFQFITLAGFHVLNHSMFDLAGAYAREGMPAYARLQRKEFESEAAGYKGAKHQAFAGVGYFDEIARVIGGGTSSTIALEGSTEQTQFAEMQGVSEAIVESLRPVAAGPQQTCVRGSGQ